jgi:predicted negative regulator of RcsB-dependent stress response
MGIVVVMLVIVVVVAWIAWRPRRHGQASAAVSPQGMFPADLAHKAFVHGNSCLMEGKFDEARAAFHQALALEPKHPHVAGRLAEVERQQQVASAVAPANTTC